MAAAYDINTLRWSLRMPADDVRARAAEEWSSCRQLDGDFGVSVDQFTDHVANLVARRAGEDSAQALAIVDLLAFQDLYLALGCLGRSDRAIRTFLDRYGSYLHHLSHRSAPDSATGDDIEQTLRATLFLPRNPDDPQSARLASYQGSGSLAGWLRVIARRLVIDEVRKLRRVSPSDRLEYVAAPQPSPEATFVQADAAARLALLVRACVAELDEPDLDLMRKRYRDGLVLREIAAELDKDITTVHRRIAALNGKLWKRIRARAREDLGLSDRDLRGLLSALAERLRLEDLFGVLILLAGWDQLGTLIFQGGF